MLTHCQEVLSRSVVVCLTHHILPFRVIVDHNVLHPVETGKPLEDYPLAGFCCDPLYWGAIM